MKYLIFILTIIVLSCNTDTSFIRNYPIFLDSIDFEDQLYSKNEWKFINYKKIDGVRINKTEYLIYHDSIRVKFYKRLPDTVYNQQPHFEIKSDSLLF